MDQIQMGKFIQARRKQLGLRQCDISKKLFVTDQAVSKWERGLSCPDTAMLVPLADILEITVVELLNGGFISEDSDIREDQIIAESISHYADVSRSRLRKIIILLIIFITLVMFTVLAKSLYENHQFYGNVEKHFLSLSDSLISEGLIPSYKEFEKSPSLSCYAQLVRRTYEVKTELYEIKEIICHAPHFSSIRLTEMTEIVGNASNTVASMCAMLSASAENGKDQIIIAPDIDYKGDCVPFCDHVEKLALQYKSLELLFEECGITIEYDIQKQQYLQAVLQ